MKRYDKLAIRDYFTPRFEAYSASAWLFIRDKLHDNARLRVMGVSKRGRRYYVNTLKLKWIEVQPYDFLYVERILNGDK